MLSGPIEIPELKGGEFPFEPVDHPRDPHPFSSPHLPEVEVWIDVEVTHLNEVKTSRANEMDQVFHLSLLIGEPREDEEIQGGVDPFPHGPPNGIDNMTEGVPPGTVIPAEVLRSGAAEGHPDAVEPCLTELLDPIR